MKLKSHARYDYSAITQRKDYSWPAGKRLAVHFCLNVEHFSFGEGLGNDYAAPHPQPNTRSFAWRDYGNRVGAWRLLELAEAYDLPYALLVNSELYGYCPEMVAAFSKRGDEIVGHGRTNAERQADMSLEEEQKCIREAADTIEKHEGKRPWAGSRPTFRRRMIRSTCCARPASAT
jgi:allantoinase